MKIEISGETVDEIIAEDLKCYIKTMLKSGYDVNESLDNKSQLLASLFRVLELYIRPSEYQEFITSLKGKKLK